MTYRRYSSSPASLLSMSQTSNGAIISGFMLRLTARTGVTIGAADDVLAAVVRRRPTTPQLIDIALINVQPAGDKSIEYDFSG
jgi:hypothetical protein